MNLVLNAELEEWVNRQVATGAFDSVQDVIVAGLELLLAEEQDFESERNSRRGRRIGAGGIGSPFGSENLVE